MQLFHVLGQLNSHLSNLKHTISNTFSIVSNASIVMRYYMFICFSVIYVESAQMNVTSGTGPHLTIL